MMHMPTLSKFNGLVIRMYFKSKEHNPPHVHVIYGDKYASINIYDGSILEGNLPAKALFMAKDWVSKNKVDLLNIWNTQKFKKLDPLS